MPGVKGSNMGRSYVGDGRSHLIDFQVNDIRMGESGGELKLDAPDNGQGDGPGRRLSRTEIRHRKPAPSIIARWRKSLTGT